MERKTFHRYVTRAKQGTVQSQYDKTTGKAHSAGANLRRFVIFSKLKSANAKIAF